MTTISKPYNRVFHIVAISSILVLTGIAVFVGFQYSSVSASSTQHIVSLEKLAKQGLPNLDTIVSNLISEKNKLSTTLNPLKLYNLEQLAKKELDKATADYTYLITQKVTESYSSIQDFQEEIAKAELIDIPSKTAVINNVSTLKDSILSSNVSLSDLVTNQTLFESQKEVFQQEVEEYRKKELVNTVETIKLEAQEAETYLLSKTGVDKTVFDNFAVIYTNSAQLLDPEYVKQTSYLLYKPALDEKIITVIKKIRVDLETVKQEEVAQREQLFKAQQELFASQGKELPQAPIKGESKLIYINLLSQTMYLFDQDKLISTNYITSGKKGFETPPGKYAIFSKERQKYLKSPFKDIEYNLLVQYWMPFFDGYGIHDAYWRTVYGGADYKYAGSHGCLNTPLEQVKFIYNWAPIGTTVFID
jgi:lipoprotein-anchoring transpeptidase ErfK/SrfK